MDNESLNKKYAKELALLDREVIREYLRKKIEQWWKNRPEALRKRYYNKKEIENLDVNKEFNEVSNWLLEIFTIKDVKFGSEDDPDENVIYLNGELVFSINKIKDYEGNDMVIRDLNTKFIKKKAFELIGDKNEQ